MKKIEFQLRHYERTGAYMVRAVGEGYLKYNEKTGAVITVREPGKATYYMQKDMALKLIEYYLMPTPYKEEIYEHFIHSE